GGWSPAGGNDTSGTDRPGLYASFWDTYSTTYASNFLTPPVASRIDPNIDANWGANAPYPTLGGANATVRWTGKLHAPEGGLYYFQTKSHDGVRVQVNGVEVLRWWWGTGANHIVTQCAGGIFLAAGSSNDIVVEYFEYTTSSASM